MSGPTFSFWYADFTGAMCSELESILRKVSDPYRRLDSANVMSAAGSKGTAKRTIYHAELHLASRHLTGSYSVERTGMMGVHLERVGDDRYPAFVRDAFQKELGFTPRFELGGYCMCNSPYDWDALRVTAERLAVAFGGYVIDQSNDPSRPNTGVREVVARDMAAYFGPRIDDAAHVREYAEYVPEARYWVTDAREFPGWSVRK